MTLQRLPDPQGLPDPVVQNYLVQLVKLLRVNLQSLYSGAVFTQTEAGTSLVYNNKTPWIVGAGSPNTVVSAPVGSLYTRTDGGANTTLYVKESGTGNTGWVAK